MISAKCATKALLAPYNPCYHAYAYLHKTLPNQNKYIYIIILKIIYLRFSVSPIKREFELTCETEC
jgi:hypothetical protein